MKTTKRTGKAPLCRQYSQPIPACRSFSCSGIRKTRAHCPGVPTGSLIMSGFRRSCSSKHAQKRLPGIIRAFFSPARHRCACPSRRGRTAQTLGRARLLQPRTELAKSGSPDYGKNTTAFSPPNTQISARCPALETTRQAPFRPSVLNSRSQP